MPHPWDPLHLHLAQQPLPRHAEPRATAATTPNPPPHNLTPALVLAAAAGAALYAALRTRQRKARADRYTLSSAAGPRFYTDVPVTRRTTTPGTNAAREAAVPPSSSRAPGTVGLRNTGETQMKIDLYDLRRREVQALGAALSCRDWQMMEAAYNSLRDKLDKAGFTVAGPPAAPFTVAPKP